jgi:hypothetical protein
MSFRDEPYNALCALLGAEHVTRDEAVTMAYSRCFISIDMVPPKCIVMPAKVSEIQEIYRLANLHNFKVIPTGTNLVSTAQPASKEFDYVTIDPKRMNGLWIDETNMMATVEPYVTFGRLQMEAMKRGLTCYIATGGAQISVLTNLIYNGFNMQSYRLGSGSRSMLAMEWVLPSGDIVRTGSAAVREDDFFWGEGPVSDLRGMFKGSYGYFGGMGMCVKIGIKLFPYPGPEKFPCEGTSPDLRVKFPEDRFRTFLIDFDTMDECVNSIYAVGHAEIGARNVHMATSWIPMIKSLCREDYFELWGSEDYRRQVHNLQVVVLEAITSPEQLDYEEAVLRDIVKENKGRFITGPLLEYTATMVAPCLLYRPNLLYRGFRVGGSFTCIKMPLDSVDHAALVTQNAKILNRRLYKNKQPPIFDDGGGSNYISPYDFGHCAHMELPVLYEKSFAVTKLGARIMAFQQVADLFSGTHPGGYLFSFLPDLMGPLMGKFHNHIRQIKAAFDPNLIANPPWPVHVYGPGLAGLRNRLRAYWKVVMRGEL